MRHNPEREWTIEEREEFFASQDALQLNLTPQELSKLSDSPTGERVEAGVYEWIPGKALKDCRIGDITPQELDALSENITDEFLITLPKQPPIEWSTGAWNGPIIELDPNDPFGDMEQIFHRGIHVTRIVPPEQGWPIAMHCPICKETTFLLSPWAIKPEKGDYWRMNEICADDLLGFEHNMRLGMKGYDAPIDLKPSEFLL